MTEPWKLIERCRELQSLDPLSQKIRDLVYPSCCVCGEHNRPWSPYSSTCWDCMISMVISSDETPEKRNNMPDRYVHPPQPVEAYQLTESSRVAESIAVWCGGEVLKEPKPGDPTDVSIRVKIPGLDGPLIAVAREWVVRDDKTGRFSVWSNERFSSEYQKVGIR